MPCNPVMQRRILVQIVPHYQEILDPPALFMVSFKAAIESKYIKMAKQRPVKLRNRVAVPSRSSRMHPLDSSGQPPETLS